MKTIALVCSVVLIGALVAVLAGPASNTDDAPVSASDSDSSDSSDSSLSSSSSGSSEEDTLTFPSYSVLPERVLKLLSDDEDSDLTDSAADDGESARPQGRTIFLLLRLFQLLNRLNLTSTA